MQGFHKGSARVKVFGGSGLQGLRSHNSDMLGEVHRYEVGVTQYTVSDHSYSKDHSQNQIQALPGPIPIKRLQFYMLVLEAQKGPGCRV